MSQTVKRPRTTKQQFTMYVNCLESYPFLYNGKLNPSMGPEKWNELWGKLRDDLNACGGGPTRDIEGWKKVTAYEFDEWKSQVRKKARTGKHLTELEKKLLEITGMVVKDGIDTMELGVIEPSKIIINEGETGDGNHEITPITTVNVVNEEYQASSSNVLFNGKHQCNFNLHFFNSH
ncbi:hypothetical protein FQR65_LT18967 [Abscondita terminalis]|nr:hypothetical protein FQR65_LT18967 [Abscondita terminalis]